jgi:hypothetical protein
MTSLGGQHRHLVQSTVTQLNQDLQEGIYYKDRNYSSLSPFYSPTSIHCSIVLRRSCGDMGITY